MPSGTAAQLAVLAAVQGLRNRLDALANDLLAAVAHGRDVEEEPGDGGFVGRLEEWSQAPELVAPCLGVSVAAATRRCVVAVELSSRAPVLVEQMRAGRLDAYRAGLIHGELEDAPEAIEARVIARLVERAERVGGWVETSGPLARRARALLARFAPEVIEARAAVDRERRGLMKFGESESLDRWDGLYLVDEARVAWASIDERAQQLRVADPTLTLSQARADAHMQLLLGQAEVTVHIHAAEPVGAISTLPVAAQVSWPRVARVSEDGVASALGSIADGGEALASGVAIPASSAGDEIVQLTGFGTAGTTAVRASWLAEAFASGRAVRDHPIACDPTTGALISGTISKGFTRANTRKVESTEHDPRYRVPEPMARLVRFRDRQCRFPGCAINARFCDLDHVIAWPHGPTSASNLICLCRRHHRLKQTPGWSVSLHPDATVEWVDPIGRRTLTHPVDHLGVTTADNATVGDPRMGADRVGPERDRDDWRPDASERSPLEGRLAALIAA